MGRPPLGERKRSATVAARFTEDELAEVTKAAEDAGVTVSDYVYTSALNRARRANARKATKPTKT